MKTIGCRDLAIDCPWEAVAAEEDNVLTALAQHAIETHQSWPEDGPIQMWERVRALIREVAVPDERDVEAHA